MDRRSVLATGALLGLAGLTRARADPGPAVTVDGKIVLEAYRALVEEHLAATLRALKALAATSDARSGGWAQIRPALAAFAAEARSAAAVWIMAADGRYHTVAGGLQPETLKDRDYFPALVAGHDVHAALVLSKSTGHRSIVVAAPVMRAGRVVAALGVSVRARLVSELVDKRAELPASLVFYALDAGGRTAIHKDPARMFEFPSDLGDPSLKAAVRTILSKPAGQVDYSFRGSRRTAVFDSSPYTGWRFVLAAVRD